MTFYKRVEEKMKEREKRKRDSREGEIERVGKNLTHHFVFSMETAD